jgi:probable F420-dependent oxidoreductase
MEISVTFPHTGRLATPDFMREFATTAEDLGFGALFGMDHMVMPVHTDSQYTLGKKPAAIQDNAVATLLAPNFEMHTSLTYVAAVTSKIKLATGVAVLPIRNTVMNARQLATLDVLSGGRVLYGVGAGWLQEEAEAMNMPWDRRGARTEESIAVMRTLWCAETDVVEFHGEFNDLPPMHPDPRPIQRPIPILVGGHSDIALARAGRVGDGWISAAMSADRVAEHWGKVKAAAAEADHDPEALVLVAMPSRRAPEDGDELSFLRAYEEVGVDILNMDARRDTPEATLAELRRLGEAVLPHFG